ncbi:MULTISPECIES: HoxN/HupN/NixA family nickel/cobalt transporter [unclassified Rhizobium]|uniref:HoxN/HupN/NixA family nickel/cobalt transporter n=1 Tax=unclassified Rhizobium TaxID=2613769 RepID=UPI000EA95320|nr:MULTISPECIES: HoxN/HupN/NixA family nickel/cobalt transporter [unclassified Rhizobium]AYG70364.1 HoxN/HupN/NixA family nickel/cobalt transporter [Rhizobium sp. CCGE531]AYG76765.1 HoxN/HupN/NixA family nickel/cobalt transporter [Rhizobium sp. CCGE532]
MRSPFDDEPLYAKTKIAIVYALLVAANVLAWIWAWTSFSDRPALLGMALVAYMLGVRHAFDADHIAAIDNVVRKLMHEGRQPFSVGFFFSLGHSSIVVLASLAVAITAYAMQSQTEGFHDIGGVIGTSVSALFLLVIGIANLVILKPIWDAFSRARRGEEIVDEDLDALLAGRGLLARVFRRTFKVVTRSWHMYPIGFLLGLGFDTATEIALLGVSASQAAQGLSFWTILVFPALFTAGMSLMDTTDSALMTGAYGWALMNPARKLWYNLTVTAASVIVAILIGGAEALGLISDKLGLRGTLWEAIATFNDSLENLGFGVVGIFIASWVVSAMIYRMKGYDRIHANVS